MGLRAAAANSTADADDIPKSVGESVAFTTEFAEGSFLGMAEAMPEEKYSFVPSCGNGAGPTGGRSKPRPYR